MTKGILAVALSERASRCDRHTSQETERILTKYRGEFLAFRPNSVFVITKHNNPRFGPKRPVLFVLLNCKDTPCRDSSRCSLFPEGSIFAERDLRESVELLLDTFVEASKPYVPIGMSIGKSLEK